MSFEQLKRIEQAKKAFITTPDVSLILNNIERCRKLSTFDAEPSCMMVYGSHGVGKTSIIKKYLKANERNSYPDGDTVPVLYIELPENAQPVDVARELLIELNDPLALHESDLIVLTKRLVDLVPLLKIELIILDEFQHLVEKSSNRILSRVGDWVKILINKTRCPVVLFGMPYSQVILAANSQLRSRFSIRFDLRPFSYLNRYNVYRKFLSRLDEALPFERLSGLAEKSTAKKIYAFSEGNMRSLRNLVFQASVDAIEQGHDCINKDDLLAASELTCGDKSSTWRNPFLKGAIVTDAMLQDPPKELGFEDYFQNNRRGKKSVDVRKFI